MKHSSSSSSSDVDQSNNEAVLIIVQYLKAQGIFDHFRRECLEDVDTKPSFSNLRQRLEGYVNRFLTQQEWSPSVNKNQLRERLRKQINESGMVKYNVDHLVDQVVTTRASTYVYPRIERVVKEYLGLIDEEEEKKKEENDQKKAIWNADIDMDKNDIQNQNIVKTEEDFQNLPSLSPSLVSSESLSTPSPSSESNHSKHSPTLSPQFNEKVSKSRFKSTFTEISLSSSDKKNSEESSSNQESQSAKSETLLPDSNLNTFTISSQDLPSNNSKKCQKPIISSSVKNLSFSPQSSNQSSISRAKPSSPKPRTESIVLLPDFQAHSTFLPELPSSSSPPFLNTNRDSNSLEADCSKIDNAYLSDVSSVHTSDLSDFDDRISISSGEEEKGLKKKKVSLKELKKIIQTEMKGKDKPSSKLQNASRNGKKKIK